MTIEKLIEQLQERKRELLGMMDERSRVYINPRLGEIDSVLYELRKILHNQTKPD